MALKIRLVGSGLKRFDDALAALGKVKASGLMQKAINKAGSKARTQAKNALVRQTGLPSGLLQRAMKVRPASGGNLVYSVVARGGDVGLKYFKARETRKGVSAAPFSKRNVFAHTFIKGGLFPNRKLLRYHGTVFEPAGGRAWGRPFEKAKSGVVIPAEMVKGASAAAWQKAGLPEMDKELARLLERASRKALTRGR